MAFKLDQDSDFGLFSQPPGLPHQSLGDSGHPAVALAGSFPCPQHSSADVVHLQVSLAAQRVKMVRFWSNITTYATLGQGEMPRMCPFPGVAGDDPTDSRASSGNCP